MDVFMIRQLLTYLAADVKGGEEEVAWCGE